MMDDHSNILELALRIIKEREYKVKKEIFDKFDQYACIKDDTWYKDFKKKELGEE